jgi:Protein of unknown function (DUF559)
MKFRPAEGATARARALRANATDAERPLWRLLRDSFPEGVWTTIDGALRDRHPYPGPPPSRGREE